MSGATQKDPRLQSLARGFLRTPAREGRLIVVSGEDVEESAALARAVQRAAGRLSLPFYRLGPDEQAVDLEVQSGPSQREPLVIYHHPVVCERDLRALRPPAGGRGPEALLWAFAPRARRSLRSLYLLGLWAWSLAPRQLRAFLPPASPGDPSLLRTRTRLRERLHDSGMHLTLDVLERPAAWEDTATNGLLNAVLESTLAASVARDPAARARSRPESAGRPARERVARLGVVLIAGWLALGAGLAHAGALRVRVEGPVRSEGVRRGGALFWSGPYHALRLQPGAGVWDDDAAVEVTVEADSLYLRVDGRAATLSVGAAWNLSGRGLELHAPEMTLVVRQGRLERDAQGYRVTPRVRGPVLPGGQGLAVTGVLLVLILLLFFRAGRMRRELDRPRTRLRRGGRSMD